MADGGSSSGAYIEQVSALAIFMRRFGRSLYGLAVLEAAWLGLVALLQTIGTSGSASRYRIPGVGSVEPSAIAWAGLWIIAVLWLVVTTGQRTALGFRLVARWSTIAFGVAIATLTFVINFPVSPVLGATHAWRSHRLALKRSAAREDDASIPSPRTSDERARQTKLDRAWARQQVGFTAFCLAWWAVGKVLAPGSIGRGSPGIVIGAMRRYDLSERLPGAVDCQRALVLACERLKLAAPTLSVGRMRIATAPVGSQRLMRASGVLSLTEVGIVGREVHPNQPIVTLARFRRTPWLAGDGTDEGPEAGYHPEAFARAGYPFQRSLPLRHDLPITVDLRDDTDVELALLLALAFLFYEPPRRVYLPSCDPIIEQIAHILDRQTDLTDSGNLYTSRGQAWGLISAWIGWLIAAADFAVDEDYTADLWRHPARTAAFLLRLAHKCVANGIDVIENQLRIGVLWCIVGDDTKAIDAFTSAMNADDSIDSFDQVANGVLVQLELDSPARTKNGHAMVAAYGARAIGAGDAEGVARDLEKDAYIRLHPNGLPTGLRVLIRLLEAHGTSLGQGAAPPRERAEHDDPSTEQADPSREGERPSPTESPG